MMLKNINVWIIIGDDKYDDDKSSRKGCEKAPKFIPESEIKEKGMTSICACGPAQNVIEALLYTELIY